MIWSMCMMVNIHTFSSQVLSEVILPLMRVYVPIYIPGAPMTCIFEGQSPKTRPFPTKTMVIWVLGIYIYNDSRIPITHRIHGTNGIFTYMKTIKNPPIKAGFLWVGSPYPCHHGKLRVPTSPMPRGNPQEIAGPNSRPC